MSKSLPEILLHSVGKWATLYSVLQFQLQFIKNGQSWLNPLRLRPSLEAISLANNFVVISLVKKCEGFVFASSSF